jgi:hypothetical protein
MKRLSVLFGAACLASSVACGGDDRSGGDGGSGGRATNPCASVHCSSLEKCVNGSCVEKRCDLGEIACTGETLCIGQRCEDAFPRRYRISVLTNAAPDVTTAREAVGKAIGKQ